MADYGLVQIRWKRDRPSGQPAEDVMVNALHFQVTDGGWTTDDRDVVVSALSDFWDNEKANFSAQVGPVELRFYNMPATAGPVGDPVFVVLQPSKVGTGAIDSTLPPQCAITVTHQTDNRRRWGRIYFGGLISSTVVNGRFSAALLTNWLDKWHDFCFACQESGVPLVVWHRASWTALPVRNLSMDDVWDVQRRRRYDHALHREEVTLTT